jgi:hypothetical protein
MPEHVCRRDAEHLWRGFLAEAMLPRLVNDETRPQTDVVRTKEARLAWQ